MHQGRQAASGDLRLDELDLTWIEHKPGKRESIEIYGVSQSQESVWMLTPGVDRHDV